MLEAYFLLFSVLTYRLVSSTPSQNLCGRTTSLGWCFWRFQLEMVVPLLWVCGEAECDGGCWGCAVEWSYPACGGQGSRASRRTVSVAPMPTSRTWLPLAPIHKGCSTPDNTAGWRQACSRWAFSTQTIIILFLLYFVINLGIYTCIFILSSQSLNHINLCHVRTL